MYTLPDQVSKAIADIFEKFDDKAPMKEGENGVNQDDILNDSALYLSSNWSTGGGGCLSYYEMFEDANSENNEQILIHDNNNDSKSKTQH